jgi:hypothetical protein
MAKRIDLQKHMLVISICSIVLLFERCSPASIDLANIDSIRHYKGGIANRASENRQKAKDYEALGISKMNSNDTSELKLAAHLFKTSLSYDYENPQVWCYLGDVTVHDSNLNKNDLTNKKLISAIVYYSKAIELDTMNDLFYFERANCYYAMCDSACFSDYGKSCNLGNTKACFLIK